MARQIESKLIQEWLFEKFPGSLQWVNEWLGPFPFKGMLAAFRVAGRRADIIIKNGSEVIIVEAKFSPEFGGLAQLEGYADLLSRTPKFQDFKGLPIRLIYLTTREDVDVRGQAELKNIEYVVFRPDWVEDEERRRKRVPPLK